MYQAMESEGDPAVIYFIAVVVLGQFLVLNLFIAVLSDSFADRTPPVSTENPKEHIAGKMEVRMGSGAGRRAGPD